MPLRNEHRGGAECADSADGVRRVSDVRAIVSRRARPRFEDPSSAPTHGALHQLQTHEEVSWPSR